MIPIFKLFLMSSVKFSLSWFVSIVSVSTMTHDACGIQVVCWSVQDTDNTLRHDHACLPPQVDLQLHPYLGFQAALVDLLPRLDHPAQVVPVLRLGLELLGARVDQRDLVDLRYLVVFV